MVATRKSKRVSEKNTILMEDEIEKNNQDEISQGILESGDNLAADLQSNNDEKIDTVDPAIFDQDKTHDLTDKGEESEKNEPEIPIKDMTDEQRLKHRQSRFNIVTEEEKLRKRAERFGTTTNNKDSTVDLDVLKKRAERFGKTTAPVLLDIIDQDKKKKRQERFGLTKEEAEKQKLVDRSKRFKSTV